MRMQIYFVLAHACACAAVAAPFRKRVREKYNLDEAPYSDCNTVCCYPCLENTQMAHELEVRAPRVQSCCG